MFSSDVSLSQHTRKLPLVLITNFAWYGTDFPLNSCKSERYCVLYISFVNSHLTYCFLVWKPRLINDFTTLKPVQRHATIHIHQGKKFPWNFISVKDGPEKRTEIRWRWNNARRLPTTSAKIQSMYRVVFLRSFISALIVSDLSSGPCLTELKFYRKFFP